MKINIYFDNIERYASGQMAAAERQDFEAELAGNAELKQAYELYRLGDEVLEQGIENELRQQLKTWAATDAAAMTATQGGGMSQPRAQVVPMRTTWARWAVAASVVLLAGFLFFRWTATGYTDAALFAASYEKPTATAFRSVDGAIDPFEAGFKFLENSDFSQAIAFFQTVPANDARYTEAQYWLGHAALQAKAYDPAIAAFQNVLTRNEIKFTEKAQWNLVLTYLAAGRTQTPGFQTLLTDIANNPDHSFQPKAKALQQKLNSIFY